MKQAMLPALALLAFVCMACSDDDSGSANDTNTGNAAITLTNLLPDEDAGFLYYSFDAEAEIAPDQAQTDAWDLKLAYLDSNSRQIDIFLNSGTVNAVGNTLGTIVDRRFEEVLEAPQDSELRADAEDVDSRIISPFVGLGPFSYTGAPDHLLWPVPQRTLVLKTAEGTYVKVQFINLYKDAPANPSRYDVGYYTLRYVKSSSRQF